MTKDRIAVALPVENLDPPRLMAHKRLLRRTAQDRFSRFCRIHRADHATN